MSLLPGRQKALSKANAGQPQSHRSVVRTTGSLPSVARLGKHVRFGPDRRNSPWRKTPCIADGLRCIEFGLLTTSATWRATSFQMGPIPQVPRKKARHIGRAEPSRTGHRSGAEKKGVSAGLLRLGRPGTCPPRTRLWRLTRPRPPGSAQQWVACFGSHPPGSCARSCTSPFCWRWPSSPIHSHRRTNRASLQPRQPRTRHCLKTRSRSSRSLTWSTRLRRRIRR